MRHDQLIALEGLLLGKSAPEVAKVLGINKATVYRWLHGDARFIAEYNFLREEFEQKARSRLLVILDKATDAVEAALDDGDAALAMQLLKGMGIIRPSPQRLTNAAEIAEQLELEKKSRRIGRECGNVKLDTDRVVAEFQYNHWTGGGREDDPSRGGKRRGKPVGR